MVSMMTRPISLLMSLVSLVNISFCSSKVTGRRKAMCLRILL